ncbi:MAG: Gfo/Idh/MocA family oxidoreductase [Rhodocyclaceae bacterium]|nr:MAG: Gfo/Idh/MocA family oxidoreductase [Rhodocyclaceae bacterium]
MHKLKVGVAGLGRAFTLMLPTFLLDPRVQLVAAADPRAAARDQFVSDFNGRSYVSVEELVTDSEVEIVYISTPHQMHAKHTKLAAMHGKHVLVEKPMALDIDDCRAMIDVCAKANVKLIVGHSHSFDMPFLKAKELITSGELGQVKMIHAMYYTDFLYRPRRPEELNTEEGGGVIFSQAAHQVDIVRLLAGSPVESVRAELGAWDKSRPTEGAYSGLMRFKNGAFASLTYSGFAHFDSDEYCGWIGEMGQRKNPESYGVARKKLKEIVNAEDEAKIKNEGTYGGPNYVAPQIDCVDGLGSWYQHFGSFIISCEFGDVRPLPDGVVVYGDNGKKLLPLPRPEIPRQEVIDEVYNVVRLNRPAIHDGSWAMATLETCLAMLTSGNERREVFFN